MTIDDRITPSHSKVPGKDGHFGLGGLVFKDISNLHLEMKKVGMKSYILSSRLNEMKLLIEKKDWLAEIKVVQYLIFFLFYKEKC